MIFLNKLSELFGSLGKTKIPPQPAAHTSQQSIMSGAGQIQNTQGGRVLASARTTDGKNGNAPGMTKTNHQSLDARAIDGIDHEIE